MGPEDSVSLAWITAAVMFLIALAASLRLRHVSRALGPASGSAAQALTPRAGETLLRTLLDASPIASLLCEDDGLIVVENEAARRLFFEGRSGEGQNFVRLVSSTPTAIQAALLSASDEMVELQLDGQRETYHFMRRNFEHLGKRYALLSVRAMTREVERHDLDVLKKVVRVLSHEVNNSLAPVSSLAHSARLILSGGERLERLEKVFDTIEERSQHLSRFIAGYASLARLPRPAPQTLEWSGLLSRLSMLFPDAELHAPAQAQGFFDPSQLEQALINLLKNANEAGGPQTAVGLEVTPLPEAAVEVCVTDRGRGFSSDALEHALLPFYTTKPGGSGVGLALVREVVHAHGGRLTLGTQDGGGAAIRVWLPGPRPKPELDTRARLTLTRS